MNLGRLQVDLDRHEVRLDGQVAPLTVKEFQLLQLLMEHSPQVISRDQIIEHLWDGAAVPQNVTGLIARVRSKIERDPDHPEYILTVWGIGYRFEGVRR